LAHNSLNEAYKATSHSKIPMTYLGCNFFSDPGRKNEKEL